MFKSAVNRRLLIIMAIGVLAIAANSIGLLRPVKSGIGIIGGSFQGVISRLGNATGGWFDVFGNVQGLASENQKLKSEVASLRQQVASDRELKAQNDELRKQLNVGSIRPDRLIAAEVTGYQPDNFRQFIVIGRGSRDGLHTGMAVISQGTLVGMVQETYATTAKVFLVIDPNFRIAALDQDQPGRPTGTIHGQIGSGLIMDKVAQTETMKPGDTIVTSGLGGEIPKGIIIGRVQTVDRRDNGVFQTAQVSTEIPFSRLEVVYVVARP